MRKLRIPLAVIAVCGVITWASGRSLDRYLGYLLIGAIIGALWALVELAWDIYRERNGESR
jgi:hypothetical protein